MPQNPLRVSKLRRRQIFAVRTRISRQFFLVKTLRGVQNLLRRIAERLTCRNLQARQRKRQRLRFFFLRRLMCFGVGYLCLPGE